MSCVHVRCGWKILFESGFFCCVSPGTRTQLIKLSGRLSRPTVGSVLGDPLGNCYPATHSHRFSPKPAGEGRAWSCGLSVTNTLSSVTDLWKELTAGTFPVFQNHDGLVVSYRLHAGGYTLDSVSQPYFTVTGYPCLVLTNMEAPNDYHHSL